MKKLIMIRFKLVLAVMSVCLCGYAHAAGTGFEDAPLGSFLNLETLVGVWSAEEGHALINAKNADLGKQCLQICGGEKRMIELQIGLQQQKPRLLSFMAERWTQRTPFVFRVSARVNNQWQELYNGDTAVKVGGFHTKVQLELPAGADRLRFTCTSPADSGVLIDDVRIGEPKPMELVELTELHKQSPVLVRNEADSVLQVRAITDGNQEPLRVKALHIHLTGTTDLEDIETVSVQYYGSNELFATPQPPAEQMIFSGDQKLPEGENLFTVLVKLKDSANLDHFISAGCSAVVVGSEQVIPASSVPQTPRRIGLALRKAGNDSCAAYRIHGLEGTPKGTLIAVYDARWKHGGDF
ncbi:MAG: BNR-repeat neuraminidase N-terminal domain-containing protein, partial [Kiritimatiellae bacterium]|nr:BNR-repeat neuraminidase N-terminal domain-containing protein [Kiritimatiellia bacterium]